MFQQGDLRNAITKGLIDAVVEKSKGARDFKTRSREDMVNDLVAWIAKESWTDEELQRIYQAARNRFKQKTCYDCGQLKPIFGGELVWPDGDMSKPKRFKCADCLGRL